MAKAQQYRVDPAMAGLVMPSASDAGNSGMQAQGNMTAAYAQRRLMRQQARAGTQRPGRVAPPPPPLALKKY